MSRLPTSGTITMDQIRNEFGASGSPDMAEYYRGGTNAARVHSYGSGHNTNIPTSGTIYMSNFYGAHRGWHLVCGQYNISTTISYVGYSNSNASTQNVNFGSINPTNYRGAGVRGIYRNIFTFKGTSSYTQSVILSGTLPRNWFNRYTDPNNTLYTANANWFRANGYTYWTWSSFQGYISNMGPYSNNATISPEFIQ